MKKSPKDARTLSEWWDRRYSREHWVVGILLGLLLGALIDNPLRSLLIRAAALAYAGR